MRMEQWTGTVQSGGTFVKSLLGKIAIVQLTFAEFVAEPATLSHEIDNTSDIRGVRIHSTDAVPRLVHVMLFGDA